MDSLPLISENACLFSSILNFFWLMQDLFSAAWNGSITMVLKLLEMDLAENTTRSWRFWCGSAIP